MLAAGLALSCGRTALAQYADTAGPAGGRGYVFDPNFVHPEDHVHTAGCGKAERLRQLFLAGLTPDGGGANPFATREALGDTDVIKNTVDIEVAPPASSISGSNTILVQSLVNGLTTFTFNLRSQYTVSSVLVNGAAVGAPVSVGTYARRITLPRAYNAGEQFEVKINYSGNAVNVGLGSIFTGTYSGNPAVFTLSEPYYAGTWFPVKDGEWGTPGDNADKAVWEIKITHPATLTTVSNGTLQGIDTLSGNRKRTRWKTDYPMSTYLAAFGTTVYNTWTQTWNYTPAGGSPISMPVQFFIFPASDNTSNRQGWDRSVQMLSTLSDWYGVYPFANEKYGIYNFSFGGGMEHQTATGQSGFGESLTAHELGHQWWGDWVTCRYWNDIWLNEGFATYTEALWLEKKPGSTGLAALKSAMSARKPSTVGDSVYCYATNDVNRIFDTDMSYSKGAWVVHMLRYLTGDTVFFNQVLPTYRQSFGGSGATTDNLEQVASAVSGQNLSKFFDDFVYGIGAPAYASSWQNLVVNGQRYLRLRVRQTQSGTYPVFAMPVEVQITTTGGTIRPRVLVDATTDYAVIPVPGTVSAVTLDPDDWILNTGKTSETYVAGPPVLLTTAPAPGSMIAAATSPSAVTLTFSDPMTVSAGNFTVTRAGTPVPFTFSYNAGTQTVTLNFGSALPAGEYTVALVGTLTNGAGVALDGEIASPTAATSLPSGNGQAGGLGSVRFSVAAPPCPADLTGDGFVDDSDFVQFAAAYDQFTVPPADAAADLNGDGFVDDGDFVVFAGAYDAFACP